MLHVLLLNVTQLTMCLRHSGPSVAKALTQVIIDQQAISPGPSGWYSKDMCLAGDGSNSCAAATAPICSVCFRYGSWGLIEYTGQPVASAPKYLAVKGLLDAKQPAGVYSGCLGPQKGSTGLGDGSFFGAPAITFPRKGAALIQVRPPSAWCNLCRTAAAAASQSCWPRSVKIPGLVLAACRYLHCSVCCCARRVCSTT